MSIFEDKLHAQNESFEAYMNDLIDRDTPMKPFYRIPDVSFSKEELAHCPKCDWKLNWERGCENNNCRQKIDWSDEK